MFKVFLYGGGMGNNPGALASFESGLHEAFLLSFGITLLAALVSVMRPSHRPLDQQENPPKTIPSEESLHHQTGD